MEFLYEYGLFFAKTITFVIAFGLIVAIAASAKKSKGQKKGELEITNLSEKYKDITDAIESELFSKDELKQKEKAAKLKAKQEKKEKKNKTEPETKSRVYVIDFKGSVDANEVDGLREEITAVLSVAKPEDEVLVRLESGGGVVHGYGLAASQLARFKAKNIPLTVSIDKVAASGGYMMACVADKILAAPFAIVGSIGVIAQIPNFHKLLKKNDVEFEQVTAGEYKRTLTMFGENTDKGREKFKHELEEIHQHFVEHIETFRKDMDVRQVATGEHWLATKAKDLGLVDELSTSDDYLIEKINSADVVQVKYQVAKSMMEKLPFAASKGAENILTSLYQKMTELKFR
ncbi:protease SohB [Catenovulum maritimum]|uniref:Peptidase n=1 Tax=Catenovulum maritimum TaxID=1513271 RepID=A0A0J8GQZ6_9ALTE|nr:protease SohB [Catenovulum maritimum]KMT65127.1 hypothetical protein XM47_10335 [Catenovulum maritimum]